MFNKRRLQAIDFEAKYVFTQVIHKEQGSTQVRLLSRVILVSTRFSLFSTKFRAKAKEPYLSNYLRVSAERRGGFRNFPWE